LALAVVNAQTPATSAKVVAGEITAIDTAAKQLKVKADDGVNYMIALQDNAFVLKMPYGETDQKKAEKITLGDVSVGDRMLARGAVSDDKSLTVKTVIIMTKSDVAKKQQGDQADWQKRGVAGTVTAVNPSANEVTLNTHGRESKSIVVDVSAATFRRYAPNSVKYADSKPSTVAELTVGDTLRARGDKNEDGTRVKAEEVVSGGFQTIAATVVSVNAAAGELVVTDLKTKKPVTVKTGSDSMLRRLEERTAMMLARRFRPGDASAGAPGAGPGGAAPGGAPAGNRPPAGDRPGGPPQGGFGAAFGGRGAGGGGGDLQQILDRSPQLTLGDLKKGDALIISSSRGPDSSAMLAMSLVAGVEPFLAAAPRTAGQVDLGSWNLSMSAPEQ